MRRPLAALVVLALAGCAEGPIEVGVLVPTSSARGAALVDAARWAGDTVNQAGGIGGRPLTLVVEDSGADPRGAAQALLGRGVRAVVGPETSRAVFAVADLFLAAEVPFVSPSATSGDLFRAFGGRQLAWRTVESDIAQVRTQLAIARRDGATRVSFLGGEDSYGATFFNWFGFFSGQLGLQRTRIVSYDQQAEPDCAPRVAEALEGAPDVLLAVPSDTATAICFARALAGRAAGTRVLFSDSGWDPLLLDALGPVAEGLEGTISVPDPASGFEDAWRARTGSDPPGYSAEAYDAVLLVAYGLRAAARSGDPLGRAMAAVVDGRGAAVGADAAGVRAALAALGRGEAVDLSGAASPLDFDRRYHTDLVASTYGRWVVKDGRYQIVERFSTGEGRDDTASIYQSYAPAGRGPISEGPGPTVGPRAGLSALVVATSRGWDNYRHQADALAVYATLRDHGVADSDIVLVVADDLAGDARNPAGTVRQTLAGPDLRGPARVDYPLAALQTGDLWSLLGGARSARLPEVVTLSPDRDLLVYLVGHGSVRGLEWAGAPGGASTLSATGLADALQPLQDRYRRAFIVVDACLAGVMADELLARGVPRAMVLASSDRAGGSFATSYDPALGVWLSDEFSTQLVAALGAFPDATLLDLYRDLYTRVPGSIVSAYNARRFGNLADIPARELFAP